MPHPTHRPTVNREALVYYRTRKGWTQEDLAEKVGVHVRTIQRAEKGEGVRGWVLCNVAQALGMPLEKLLPNEAPQLEPTEAFKKSVHALLKLLFDLPAESVETLRTEQYGEKVLGALSLVGLLRDGATNLHVGPGNSVVVSATVTADDGRRIRDAFDEGELHAFPTLRSVSVLELPAARRWPEAVALAAGGVSAAIVALTALLSSGSRPEVAAALVIAAGSAGLVAGAAGLLCGLRSKSLLSFWAGFTVAFGLMLNAAFLVGAVLLWRRNP